MSGIRALCRSLTILAVVALAFAPVTGRGAAVDAARVASVGDKTAMPVAPGAITSMPEDMTCCPPSEPAALPDCGKACPLAMLCFAPCPASLAVEPPGIIDRIPYVIAFDLGDAAPFRGLTDSPPPEPPRS